jgi:lambda family phage portal protein
MAERQHYPFRRTHGQRATKVSNFVDTGQSFEAGSQRPRTKGWTPPQTTANSALLYELRTIRNRSRRAVANDGYAKGTVDRLVTNIVGTGIKPLSQARNPEFRKLIHALFERWTDESDADGLMDFYGQQALAVREWLEAGECFVRRRPRLPQDKMSVPLQLQIIEPEQLAIEYDTIAANGNRIRGGVEFDAIGRRVAYYFYPERPDLEFFNNAIYHRVSADNIIPMFDPLRAGQIRGVPGLTAALVRFWELEKFDDATLLRQQVGNLFAGFVKGAELNDAHPLTGLTVADKTQDEKPIVSLEPGTLQELGPGEEIEFSNPPAPAQTYPDFMKQQLRGACAATGVPYEILTGDMSGLNDRTMRVLLGEFRRRVAAWQHQVVAFQFCRRVWGWWFDAVFRSGAVPIAADYQTDPTPYVAVKWMPQGWPYINPVQDIEASKEAVRNGFSTRSAEVSERGEDAEVIDQQQADDNTRADSLGVRYDSDGRFSAKASGTQPADPGDEPVPPANPVTAHTSIHVSVPVSSAAPITVQPAAVTMPITVAPADLTVLLEEREPPRVAAAPTLKTFRVTARDADGRIAEWQSTENAPL